MENPVVRRSLMVVAAALSVIAVGCGATGGAGQGSAEVVASGVAPKAQRAAYLAEAAKTTGAVTSERFTITVSTAPSGNDPSVSVTSSGEVDGANGRAHLTAKVSGKAGTHEGDATIETIYDGDTVYLKAPFTSMVSKDKPWVKVSSPKLAKAVEELGTSVQPDPDSFLAFLEGAGGPVKTVGTEDVRGVATRHVQVQLDIAKLVDRAAGTRKQKLTQQLTQHGISLDDLAPVPADAWIDDDGYVRRFSVAFDLAELGKLHKEAKATGVITETIELYDFNEPVTVAAPPADQVAELDLSKLLGN